MNQKSPPRNRALLVACFDPDDLQFGGMRKAIAHGKGKRRLRCQLWDGSPVDNRSLGGSLIIAGHGSDAAPRLGDGAGRCLAPDALRLAPGSQLFLLGCHQGRGDLRTEWARGAGLPRESVHGAEGETETLISTLFVLHLLREGEAGTAELFEAWVLANRIIRPFFREAREVYRMAGGDPVAVLEYLWRVTDLSAVGPFLELARSQQQYLSGLLPADRACAQRSPAPMTKGTASRSP